MLRLIIVLLFLIISVWAGIEMTRHPGYLLIVFQPWMVQMPIWFALLTLIILFALFYLLVDSISRLQFSWFRMKNWFRFRKEHKAYHYTQAGLAALIEENYKKAEKDLIAGVNESVEPPLINYLGAATAAQRQGAFDRRDVYIKKAYQVAPQAELAIGLTHAQLEIEQNQIEPAVATLNHLREKNPRHSGLLRMQKNIYLRLNDWQNLRLLLPDLRKAKVLNSEEYDLLEKKVYCELLTTSLFKDDQDLFALWRRLPKPVRKDPDVVAAFVEQLARFPGHDKEIDDLIRKTLKYHWQSDLVRRYGTTSSNNLNQKLVTAGAWLKVYGPKPELLVLLGKICLQLKLWGKAKDYLEKALTLETNAEATLTYGKLLEELDEREKALKAYRDGLRHQLPNPIPKGQQLLAL